MNTELWLSDSAGRSNLDYQDEEGDAEEVFPLGGIVPEDGGTFTQGD